jgi:hypothetical protein
VKLTFGDFTIKKILALSNGVLHEKSALNVLNQIHEFALDYFDSKAILKQILADESALEIHKRQTVQLKAAQDEILRLQDEILRLQDEIRLLQEDNESPCGETIFPDTPYEKIEPRHNVIEGEYYF